MPSSGPDSACSSKTARECPYSGKPRLRATRYPTRTCEHPQVILLDLDLGIERGLDLLPSLLEKFSPARILILTALADTQQHLAAVASGASGVVLKEQAPETLIQAIESVYSGEAWLGKSLMSAVMGKLSRTSSDKPDPEAEKIARLTPREVEIVASGQRRAQRGANRETVTDFRSHREESPDVDSRQAGLIQQV